MMSIADFVDCVSMWSPGFSERIRGASAREIEELSRVVDVPLPEVYVQFLARMGHGPGDIFLAMGDSADISVVAERYRVHEWNKSSLPADCVFIGVHGLDLYLALQIVPEREPRVVFATPFVDDGVDCVCAETFVGYLGRCAFESFRCAHLRHRLSYNSSYSGLSKKHVVGEVRDVLMNAGFLEEWCSDSISFCGERSGVLVWATQYERQGMMLILSSSDLRQAEEVGSLLTQRFNISRMG